MKSLKLIVAFSVLFLSTVAGGAEWAELGGRVMTLSGESSLGIPATLNVYSENACVGSTSSGLDGVFTAVLPVGTYWLQVMAAGTEVAAQRVTVGVGSWQLLIPAHIEVMEFPPVDITVKFRHVGRETPTVRVPTG